MTARALLLENIHPDASARLAKQRYQVDTLTRALGDLRPRPDAEQVHVADGLDELILAERAWQRVDLIALLGQPRRRIRMDVLEQQRFRRHASPHLSHYFAQVRCLRSRSRAGLIPVTPFPSFIPNGPRWLPRSAARAPPGRGR